MVIESRHGFKNVVYDFTAMLEVDRCERMKCTDKQAQKRMVTSLEP